MKAIHILSTAPAGENYCPLFYELAAMVLSALLWREHNGKICLYTDRRAFQFIEQTELSGIWDEIDLQVLDSLPEDIDWSIFWAGAKLIVLQKEMAPVAMIDTDLFMWQNILHLCNDHQLVVLHRESLIDCYLPKNKLPIAEGYNYPEGLDWTIEPCNTAFSFFDDNEFKDLYVREAIHFMKGNTKKTNDGTARMVFAEQRLLAMLANREGVDIKTIVDNPFASDNKIFTHLWGSKRLARKNPVQRVQLEDAILQNIRKLSVPVYEKLSGMNQSRLEKGKR